MLDFIMSCISNYNPSACTVYRFCRQALRRSFRCPAVDSPGCNKVIEQALPGEGDVVPSDINRRPRLRLRSYTCFKVKRCSREVEFIDRSIPGTTRSLSHCLLYLAARPIVTARMSHPRSASPRSLASFLPHPRPEAVSTFA